MIKLYDFLPCPFGQKVRIALAEKGLTYDLVQIDIAKGQDWLYWPTSLFSIILVTVLSLLELFIAGLQAFVFAFLTAIYIALAKHPPH